jgi:predicted alpha/beta superfamily hydrolase
VENFGYKIFSAAESCPAVLYITSEDISGETENILKEAREISGRDFSLCEVIVYDWDKMLTPWDADCFNNRAFEGRGEVLLRELAEEVLPEFHGSEIYIAGYSLAGLFSLWSMYRCDFWDGAVCCSSSLWYPKWKEFAAENHILRESDIYLSLGKKEEHTKNPVMKPIGDMTRMQYELMQNDRNVKNITLEWNDGGHFTDVPDRLAKGIGWILQKDKFEL